MNEDRPRPLLAAAFTCERVLREADGVISAIRLVDTVTVALPETTPANATPIIPLWAVVYFKSGDAVGRYTVSLVMRPPAGAPSELGQPIVIELQGGAQGATLAFDLTMALKRTGLYWIDVLLDGERVTSMPLTLRRG